MSCPVVDLGPCQADPKANQEVNSCATDHGRYSLASLCQKGRLRVGDGFNLTGSIIGCNTCKLMPVKECPMHLEETDEFSLTISSVKDVSAMNISISTTAR